MASASPFNPPSKKPCSLQHHVYFSKEILGINLTTTTSLPELEEMQLFLMSDIQMFEIFPLLQHPVLSLERIQMFVVMIRALHTVFHRNL